MGWAKLGPKPNGLVTVYKHSNQPPHHLLQNVNYSRSACKCRQGAEQEGNKRGSRRLLGVV